MNSEVKERGMMWHKALVSFLMYLWILFRLLNLSSLLKLPYGLLWAIITIGFCVLIGFAAYHLKHFTKYAIPLLMTLLWGQLVLDIIQTIVVENVIGVSTIDPTFLGGELGYCVFALLNTVYYSKRKYMFGNASKYGEE